jgi:hypothetical protein
MPKKLTLFEKRAAEYVALQEAQAQIADLQQQLAAAKRDGDRWRDEARQWADLAKNGMQWLRNVETGSTLISVAIDQHKIGFRSTRSAIDAARQKEGK